MRPFHPLCLVLLAASAPVALAAPTATGVIAKDGVEVSLLPTVAPASGPASLIDVTLDVEARTDEAARRLGYRSLRGLASVDCRQGVNRFTSAVAYSEASLKGAGVVRSVSGAWVQPTADSYMAAVTARTCSGAASAAPGPPPVVTAGADALPPPLPPGAVSIVPPKPQPAARTTTVAAPPPPAPARSAAVIVAPKPQPVTTTAAHAPQPGGARSAAAIVAQVTASPTARGAQRVLDALRAQIAAPLTGTVEPALVNGAQVYRANVTGFASKAEARAFCVQAAGVSKTCWVRLPSAPKKA